MEEKKEGMKKEKNKELQRGHIYYEERVKFADLKFLTLCPLGLPVGVGWSLERAMGSEESKVRGCANSGVCSTGNNLSICIILMLRGGVIG